MKKIYENKIVNVDSNLFDNKFMFEIPVEMGYSDELDLAKELEKYKNTEIEVGNKYKLWNEVYSPKKEFEIFENAFYEAISKDKKVHISNISLKEEIDLVRDFYLKCSYFNKELNCFEIDFANCPITIWVNIKNILYSSKDYNTLKEKALFIPPPREPKHQKAINIGINSNIISVIWINSQEKNLLEQIIKLEKIWLSKIWKMIFYNYAKIGFEIKEFIEMELDLH